MLEVSSAKVSRELSSSGRLCLNLGLIGLVFYFVLRIEYLAIVSSLAIAATLASTLVAKASLKGLRAEVIIRRRRVRAGEPVSAQIVLSNRNRLLPVAYPVVDLREGDERRIQRFRYTGIVPPHAKATLPVYPLVHFRGERNFNVVAAYSFFPFGFVETRIVFESVSNTVLVWPQLARFPIDSIFREPPSFTLFNGGDHSPSPNPIEASRIRDYNVGDSKRFINWKLSAKTDKLMVIESRQTKKERYELHLSTSAEIWRFPPNFERMLKLVSILAPELLKRRCLQGVTIDNLFYPVADQIQLARFLDALSLLQITDTPIELPPSSRKGHLWIMPDHKRGIALASLPTSLSMVNR